MKKELENNSLTILEDECINYLLNLNLNFDDNKKGINLTEMQKEICLEAFNSLEKKIRKQVKKTCKAKLEERFIQHQVENFKKIVIESLELLGDEISKKELKAIYKVLEKNEEYLTKQILEEL